MSSETSKQHVVGAPAQPVLVAYAPDQEVRIDLFAVAKTLWSGKWIIAGITFLFVAAGLAYAFLATPIYRAESVLVANQSEQVGNLPASLVGLTSLAGINLGQSSGTTDSLATLRSRVFVEEFIRDKNLMPLLYADKWNAEAEKWIGDDPDEWPDIQEGVQFFVDELRTVDEDAATGLVTLAIEWTDPLLVSEWVDDMVRRINERLRKRDLGSSERRLAYLNEQLGKASLVELRQAISRLIESEVQTMMLVRADTEYAFKIIDPPRVPIESVAPEKLAISLLAFLAGSFTAMFYVIIRGRADSKSANVAIDERA